MTLEQGPIFKEFFLFTIQPPTVLRTQKADALSRTGPLPPDSELRRGGPLAPPGLGRDPHVVERVGVQILQRVLRARRVFDCLVLRKLLKTETNRTD